MLTTAKWIWGHARHGHAIKGWPLMARARDIIKQGRKVPSARSQLEMRVGMVASKGSQLLFWKKVKTKAYIQAKSNFNTSKLSRSLEKPLYLLQCCNALISFHSSHTCNLFWAIPTHARTRVYARHCNSHFYGSRSACPPILCILGEQNFIELDHVWPT
jgi:hypothetical protein